MRRQMVPPRLRRVDAGLPSAPAPVTGHPVLRNLLIPLALGYILLRVVWFVPIMMVRQWRADGCRDPYTPAATPASVPRAHGPRTSFVPLVSHHRHPPD